MKPLLLILALSMSAYAQTSADDKWKYIKEMSGEVSDHPGIIIEVRASKIARGEDYVKLMVRLDFPYGAPRKVFAAAVPRGFDPTSIARIEGAIELNCQSLVIKPAGKSSTVYQFNGKKHKSKELPFSLDSSHIFAQYFCEMGDNPSQPPVLKPPR